MTHKPFEAPIEKIYVPLHVGRALSQDFGYIGDDTGDNISDLNPYFGELTGIYWIWKNDLDSDYIGVCHYRRFFVNDSKELLCEADFKNILKNYDLMISDVVEHDKTNYAMYDEAHNIDHLMAVKESCKKLYPEYDSTFKEFLEDKSLCYANICMMPRDMFMSYCEWMFSILFDASEKIDVSNCDLYQKRVYGFLSERLLNVFVRYNNFKVYENFVGANDEKAETKELRQAIGLLISQKKIDEARQMFLEVIKLRPDVALPMSDVLRCIPIIDHITYILKLEKDRDDQRLLSYSDNLDTLMNAYKETYNILLAGISMENKEYLEKIRFSPVMAATLTKGNLSSVMKKPALDINKVKADLEKFFSKSDYSMYIGLIG